MGENREYRADVVGASAVRYPQGLLEALEIMMAAPAPAAGSLFASPARFGATRWVWIDPFVGHRDDPVVPGDLDAHLGPGRRARASGEDGAVSPS